MSNDLKRQIRHLAAVAESAQSPITMDDVRARRDGHDDTQPPLRPAEPEPALSRGAWPALVAAAVVLVIFGVFAWVFPTDERPPTDSLPEPGERELGYYSASTLPEGFELQDIEMSSLVGHSSVLYLRDIGTTWLPGDGGFQIHEPFGSPLALPADPADYLDRILESMPGSSGVDVNGRRGVILETEYADGPVTTVLVSLLVFDEHGGAFEITASGMTREDVLSVAEGVERVPVDEFVGLGEDLSWDLRVYDEHDVFQYQTPETALDAATRVDVVLGPDLLRVPRLAHADQEMTVITTEDGSIVESERGPTRSRSALVYLDVPEGTAEEARTSLEAAGMGSVEFSPTLLGEFTDRYLDQINNASVLSTDPYVIQAPAGPEPRFDTSELGEQLPLEPAASLDVIPERTLFRGSSVPVASQARPVIVIGTVRQPGSEAEPVTGLIWFTDAPGVNHGLAVGEGIGSGGGSYPLDRYGIGVRGGTRTEGSSEVEHRLLYSVPLETSVVQIVTGSGSYWQRPAGGHGAISWGDTVDEPTTITAFDAEGDQLGEWEVEEVNQPADP